MKCKAFVTVATIGALLALSIATAAALAAPAPKTTGDIGYTAYTTTQRHLKFVGIQSETNECYAYYDVTGVTALDFEYGGNHYVHDAVLTQQATAITGVGGGYPQGGPYAYAWSVNPGVDSSVVGTTFKLKFTYDTGAPGVVTYLTGTINPTTGTISGTWTDNFGGTRTGTFTASGVTVAASFCAKGYALYTDANGLWYLVAVKAVSVSNTDAWFAGPVVAGNVGAGYWLFAKVHDGGEPAYLVDQVWGSFTDQVTAINGVLTHGTPKDGPFPITSGNLQVH